MTPNHLGFQMPRRVVYLADVSLWCSHVSKNPALRMPPFTSQLIIRSTALSVRRTNPDSISKSVNAAACIAVPGSYQRLSFARDDLYASGMPTYSSMRMLASHWVGWVLKVVSATSVYHIMTVTSEIMTKLTELELVSHWIERVLTVVSAASVYHKHDGHQ
jgi:hypothetical protein